MKFPLRSRTKIKDPLLEAFRDALRSNHRSYIESFGLSASSSSSKFSPLFSSSMLSRSHGSIGLMLGGSSSSSNSSSSSASSSTSSMAGPGAAYSQSDLSATGISGRELRALARTMKLIERSLEKDVTRPGSVAAEPITFGTLSSINQQQQSTVAEGLSLRVDGVPLCEHSLSIFTSSLRSVANLKHLSLTECHLSSGDVRILMDTLLLDKPSVTSLSFSRNPIGDLGIESIARYVRVSEGSVHNLELEGISGLSAHGVGSLVALLEFVKVPFSVNLSMCPDLFESAHIDRLIAAANNNVWVTRLRLEGCGLSAAQSDRLDVVLARNVEIVCTLDVLISSATGNIRGFRSRLNRARQAAISSIPKPAFPVEMSRRGSLTGSQADLPSSQARSQTSPERIPVAGAGPPPLGVVAAPSNAPPKKGLPVPPAGLTTTAASQSPNRLPMYKLHAARLATLSSAAIGSTSSIASLPSIAHPHPSRRFDVGFASSKGPRREMQDVLVVRGGFGGKPNQDFFGIFDGHGGRSVATFAADRLVNLVASQLHSFSSNTQPMSERFPPDVILRRAIHQCQSELESWATITGTTATLVLITEGRMDIAVVGDSKALVVQGRCLKCAYRLNKSIYARPGFLAESLSASLGLGQGASLYGSATSLAISPSPTGGAGADASSAGSATSDSLADVRRMMPPALDHLSLFLASSTCPCLTLGSCSGCANCRSPVHDLSRLPTSLEIPGSPSALNNMAGTGNFSSAEGSPALGGSPVTIPCRSLLNDHDLAGSFDGTVLTEASSPLGNGPGDPTVLHLPAQLVSQSVVAESLAGLPPPPRVPVPEHVAGETDNWKPRLLAVDTALPGPLNTGVLPSVFSPSALRAPPPILPPGISSALMNPNPAPAMEPGSHSRARPHSLHERLALLELPFLSNCDLIFQTRDHTPEVPGEAERIASLGGNVVNGRVNGQLLVSRAIGDSRLTPYVSSQPDIYSLALTGVEDFVVLASDGVWSVLSPREVIDIVRRHIRAPVAAADQTPGPGGVPLTRCAQAAADAILAEAYVRESADNAAVIVISRLHNALGGHQWTRPMRGSFRASVGDSSTVTRAASDLDRRAGDSTAGMPELVSSASMDGDIVRTRRRSQVHAHRVPPPPAIATLSNGIAPATTSNLLALSAAGLSQSQDSVFARRPGSASASASGRNSSHSSLTDDEAAPTPSPRSPPSAAAASSSASSSSCCSSTVDLLSTDLDSSLSDSSSLWTDFDSDDDSFSDYDDDDDDSDAGERIPPMARAVPRPSNSLLTSSSSCDSLTASSDFTSDYESDSGSDSEGGGPAPAARLASSTPASTRSSGSRRISRRRSRMFRAELSDLVLDIQEPDNSFRVAYEGGAEPSPALAIACCCCCCPTKTQVCACSPSAFTSRRVFTREVPSLGHAPEEAAILTPSSHDDGLVEALPEGQPPAGDQKVHQWLDSQYEQMAESVSSKSSGQVRIKPSSFLAAAFAVARLKPTKAACTPMELTPKARAALMTEAQTSYDAVSRLPTSPSVSNLLAHMPPAAGEADSRPDAREAPARGPAPAEGGATQGRKSASAPYAPVPLPPSPSAMSTPSLPASPPASAPGSPALGSPATLPPLQPVVRRSSSSVSAGGMAAGGCSASTRKPPSALPIASGRSRSLGAGPGAPASTTLEEIGGEIVSLVEALSMQPALIEALAASLATESRRVPPAKAGRSPAGGSCPAAGLPSSYSSCSSSSSSSSARRAGRSPSSSRSPSSCSSSSSSSLSCSSSSAPPGAECTAPQQQPVESRPCTPSIGSPGLLAAPAVSTPPPTRHSRRASFVELITSLAPQSLMGSHSPGAGGPAGSSPTPAGGGATPGRGGTPRQRSRSVNNAVAPAGAVPLPSDALESGHLPLHRSPLHNSGSTAI
ncbi:hypothetical protein H696_00047 [Fonticula alba]|uniref:PPM-type phosphatase domain-containing protein n=1 Tax=Fonticula alba TaxID=691883 RepID=A0A058ZDI1_FONAL|nr:hypothetical protein H696_00047 [Fonticula alba]KCV72455.1 hypothetical protein H696_00047 [Fonticula alba]|eukprot:XP_009492156.1 hypothetical protein H696_00047 [Fonticula alba]